MTNEEVLKLIEDGRIIPTQIKANDEETSKYNLENLEALNMVIKALEQENTLDKIRAEIERKANSGQWSEAVVYGMKKSIVIIDKYRESEDKK
jgi:hypothetical protein